VPLQVLQALIDERDTLEIVRDQIAAILVAETANQKALALVAHRDPQQWALRVFTERMGAVWHEFTATDEGDTDVESVDPTPIVSVSFESLKYDKERSDPSGRQQATAVYNLDIYGYGVATRTAVGHDSGEMLAQLEVHRAYRLIRNTLMADINEQLQMIGTVADRWLSFKMGELSRSEHDTHPVERVGFGRAVLEVTFLEYTPEYQGVILDNVAGTVKRTETGEIYFKTTT
jgi:hypothetical protein